MEVFGDLDKGSLEGRNPAVFEERTRRSRDSESSHCLRE